MGVVAHSQRGMLLLTTSERVLLTTCERAHCSQLATSTVGVVAHSQRGIVLLTTSEKALLTTSWQMFVELSFFVSQRVSQLQLAILQIPEKNRKNLRKQFVFIFGLELSSSLD